MVTQNAAEIKKLYLLYVEITTRLLANSPFSSPAAAWQGYECIALIADINVGLDYISHTATLHLMANSRTDSLAHVPVATRRGRGDYENHITPQTFAKFSQGAFEFDGATTKLLAAYIEAQVAYNATHNGRIERALTIASDGSINRLDASSFQVDSQTGAGTHAVTLAEAGWTCTCLDRAPKAKGHKFCKHVIGVLMSLKAKLDIPQAKPAKTARINGNGNGRRLTTCKVCLRDWQECNCQSGQLPEPARITTPDNIDQPLTVEEQERAAWNSLGIKQEAGRRTSASLAIRH